MPCCAAWNCSNKSKKGKSFHLFPQNEERRKKWIAALRRENFIPTQHSVICADHFQESCFDRTGQTVRLRDNAIPTIFNFPLHLQKTNKPRKAPAYRPSPESPAPQPSTSAQPALSASTDILTGTCLSDHSYHLASPRKLKRKLDKMQDLLESTKKRHKVLQKKHARLSRKVRSLAKVVQSLKSKCMIYSRVQRCSR